MAYFHGIMTSICGQQYLCTAVHVKPKRLQGIRICMIPVGAFVAPELTTHTSTVVEEIRCFCCKNVAVHTENCKLDLLLNCSTTTQMKKNIQRMLA